jgi:hypothetical protein
MQVESAKKKNTEVQTTFEERLLKISNGYNEKIGIPVILVDNGQQSKVETMDTEVQT